MGVGSKWCEWDGWIRFHQDSSGRTLNEDGSNGLIPSETFVLFTCVKVASGTLTLSSWAEPGEVSSSGSSPPAAAAYTRKKRKDICEASTPNKVLQLRPSCSFSSGQNETSRCVWTVYNSCVAVEMWKWGLSATVEGKLFSNMRSLDSLPISDFWSVF